jgi:RNA recognition motif-containing protein
LKPFAFQRRFLSDNNTQETENLEAAEPVAEATEAVTEHAATEESIPVVPLGPESPSLATKPEGTSSLYIGNLFFEVTPEEIEQTFSAVGPVKSLKIIRDSRGLSKGYDRIPTLPLRSSANTVLVASDSSSLKRQQMPP